MQISLNIKSDILITKREYMDLNAVIFCDILLLCKTAESKHLPGIFQNVNECGYDLTIMFKTLSCWNSIRIVIFNCCSLSLMIIDCSLYRLIIMDSRIV